MKPPDSLIHGAVDFGMSRKLCIVYQLVRDLSQEVITTTADL